MESLLHTSHSSCFSRIPSTFTPPHSACIQLQEALCLLCYYNLKLLYIYHLSNIKQTEGNWENSVFGCKTFVFVWKLGSGWYRGWHGFSACPSFCTAAYYGEYEGDLIWFSNLESKGLEVIFGLVGCSAFSGFTWDWKAQRSICYFSQHWHRKSLFTLATALYFQRLPTLSLFSSNVFGQIHAIRLNFYSAK